MPNCGKCGSEARKVYKFFGYDVRTKNVTQGRVHES